MGARPQVVVAVVSWNTRELLARCLSSLSEDATAGRCDVWVVDNASTDGSALMVREEFPWVTLVASDQNLGFGAAVNLVAARTESEWIVPSNADIRVTRGSLAQLIDLGIRQERVGAVAPRLVLPDGATQRSVYPFPTLAFTFAYAFGLVGWSQRLAVHWGIDRGYDPDMPRTVDWAVGAFLLVRRAAWDEIGGFSSDQWMYAEDVDLGWRLFKAGWTTRYEPVGVIHHDESAATKLAWGDERHERWHASTYAWLIRRRGPLVARLTAITNVAGYTVQARLLGVGRRFGRDPAAAAQAAAINAARAHRIGLRRKSELERLR